MSSIAIRVAIRLWWPSRRTSSVTSIVFGIADSVCHRAYFQLAFQLERKGGQRVIEIFVLENDSGWNVNVGGGEVPDRLNATGHHQIRHRLRGLGGGGDDSYLGLVLPDEI